MIQLEVDLQRDLVPPPRPFTLAELVRWLNVVLIVEHSASMVRVQGRLPLYSGILIYDLHQLNMIKYEFFNKNDQYSFVM